MSWSIEVYSGREQRLTAEQLEHCFAEALPSLRLCDGPVADSWGLCDPNSGERFVNVLAASFSDECGADPELIPLLEKEITDSDADDGDVDENYTTALRNLLRNARWHYTLSSARADDPQSEIATVRAGYAVAQSGAALVHDLQSGAWMDANLFEEMLDAYSASVPF